MDDRYLVVIFIILYDRFLTDDDVGGSQDLGEIRFQHLPCLLWNKCTVFRMDDPVYLVQSREGPVILFFCADKGEQEHYYSQTNRKSSNGDQ